MLRINFNMGCIEITVRYTTTISDVLINFNMGCIEMLMKGDNNSNGMD